MSNTDLADLLKEIINKAVDVMGASLGIVKSVEADKGICDVQPDDGSPTVTAKLHKGQKPKVDSKVAFISTHIDSVEENNYTILHIFDYDEHLVKANESVILEVGDNKLTVLKKGDKILLESKKIYLGSESAKAAVQIDKLKQKLNDIEAALNKHTHPNIATSIGPQAVLPPLDQIVLTETEELASEKVFLE